MNQLRELLRSRLTEAQLRNNRYSLRKFAEDLSIDRSSLSAFLSGRQNLSKTSVTKVFERLELSPQDERKLNPKMNKDEIQLSEDEFHLIADWYYFAILNLAKCQTPLLNNKKIIAKRLGLAHRDAQGAVDRLLKLGYLNERDGFLERTVKAVKTSRDIPSRAIKSHHRQNLIRAQKSLDIDDLSLREFSSITLALDISILPEAKKKISQFKERMEKMLEKSGNKEVYTLAIQLFPQSRK